MRVRGDDQALTWPDSPHMVNLYTFLNCYGNSNVQVYDTECPSEQVSKSFRGELVTIPRSMTRRYEAKYLLDSSGWYAKWEISPLGNNILPWSEAQPNWADTYEMRGWSVRRLLDGRCSSTLSTTTARWRSTASAAHVATRWTANFWRARSARRMSICVTKYPEKKTGNAGGNNENAEKKK